MAVAPLKSPFPYFGAKSRVTPIIWQRFGKPKNFIDPFFGSGAVLLGCPYQGHTETVNDADGLLCNVFRALQHDPEAVAAHADYPIIELDLHSRHRWLCKMRPDIERLLDDPEYYDPKAAGWWLWGISQWIGSGWCDGSVSKRLPSVARGAEKGIHRKSFGQLPAISADGTGNAYRMGIHQKSFGQLPVLSAGRGESIICNGVHQKTIRSGLPEYFDQLSQRLRNVRITCGDFERVLTASVTYNHGLTAVVLDPPYDRNERGDVYAVESDAAHRAQAWAIANGDNPLLRVALCGYGIDSMPDGWTKYEWKANGGYGNQANGRGRANAKREVIWFSPHCLSSPQASLLDL